MVSLSGDRANIELLLSACLNIAIELFGADDPRVKEVRKFRNLQHPREKFDASKGFLKDIRSNIASGKFSQKSEVVRSQVMSTPELTLFISHSSADMPVAKALVELFEKALKLPARQIRCTSVDGYRLPVGADTNEQLRREVFVARAFIGVITPISMRSSYVLFELGARWGANKHLAPVIAGGADATILAGPLSSLNGLRLDRREQVIQLIQDVSEYLQQKLEPLASFQGAIDSLVTVASLVSASAELSSLDVNDSRQLVFRNNSYWRQSGDKDDGPFCSRRYDVDRKLIRLTVQAGLTPRCTNCDKLFPRS